MASRVHSDKAAIHSKHFPFPFYRSQINNYPLDKATLNDPEFTAGHNMPRSHTGQLFWVCSWCPTCCSSKLQARSSRRKSTSSTPLILRHPSPRLRFQEARETWHCPIAHARPQQALCAVSRGNIHSAAHMLSAHELCSVVRSVAIQR